MLARGRFRWIGFMLACFRIQLDWIHVKLRSIQVGWILISMEIQDVPHGFEFWCCFGSMCVVFWSHIWCDSGLVVWILECISCNSIGLLVHALILAVEGRKLNSVDVLDLVWMVDVWRFSDYCDLLQSNRFEVDSGILWWCFLIHWSFGTDVMGVKFGNAVSMLLAFLAAFWRFYGGCDCKIVMWSYLRSIQCGFDWFKCSCFDLIFRSYFESCKVDLY